MAALSYECSIDQAFNFQKDEQVLLGHIVGMKIAGVDLEPDIYLADPLDSGKTIGVVGAISSISWAGGYGQPISIVCNVSGGNQVKTACLVYDKMIDTTVEFQFNTYSFDPIAKKYYPCFHSNGETIMLGLLLKEEGELKLSIGLDLCNDDDPMLEISIMPQEIAQQLCIAVSDTQKFVKPWGVKVSA